MTAHPRAQAAGDRKAPRHEVAGSWAPTGTERYGDLMPAPASMVVGTLAGCELLVCRTGGRSRVRGVLAVVGGHQRAIGALMAMIGSREIVAGVRQRIWKGKAATLTASLGHDVSILPGVGRYLGSQPRAKTSMMIMRPPQQGQGQGSTRGVRRGIRLLLRLGDTRGEHRAARGRGRCWRRGWRWRTGRSGGCGGSPWAARASGSAG